MQGLTSRDFLESVANGADATGNALYGFSVIAGVFGAGSSSTGGGAIVGVPALAIAGGAVVAGAGLKSSAANIRGILEQQYYAAGGKAANEVGRLRVEKVVELTGGTASGEKVSVKTLGSTDLDVIGPSGELISVGGPAKAGNLGNFVRELRIYQAIASQRGVYVKAYLAEGTPQSAIDKAIRELGEKNVFIFTP
ncbi:hypothetical protein [Anthocerotibacter panamensis]|uniref:hypothetical protein n=1 Tax=Anthocerotibacter panamensis TaxID=2857077 RepID=UPI001C403005|nr:hypothetical protein [Anthocerotibacter panamensis]